MSSTTNYFLFPFTLLLFVGNELTLTFFLRILSSYELIRDGKDNIVGSTFNAFWGLLVMTVVLYFLTLALKYYLLYRVVLNSNIAIHQAMLNSILRSPASYFDSTSSGVLINKFSNDLGVLDK
jgi:ATP-binding cassette subfamily C (CFTR/MRP) protein 4